MTLEELSRELPPPWPHDLTEEIRRVRAEMGCVVVLDDDPTGTQTVHDVPVVCTWEADLLATELAADPKALYVSTNSRSLAPAEAAARYREIGRNLVEATQRSARRPSLVSRSDSTLRGHFPLETDALIETFIPEPDALLLVPAFLEGGRYTAGDVHYAEEDGELVPVAETPFAQDPSFGYHHSDLKRWVEEKTGGRVRASDVASLSLQLIREAGPDGVLAAIRELCAGTTCIVNVLHRRDLEVVALAVLRAQRSGARYLVRSAASFVPVLAAIPPKPLLDPKGFVDRGPGLIVVGSYVPKSSAQLEFLLASGEVEPLELRVERLFDPATRMREHARVHRHLNELIARGRDVALFTSRELFTGKDALKSNRMVSESLVAVVRGLIRRPGFIITKGGITSSDLATKALGVKRALVLGQLLPGVPVWQLDDGLAYVIFPGNVGGVSALYEAYRKVKR